MATKTFEELKQLAIQIRDEKTNKQNTATRIGTQMLEHLDKLEQDYYDKTTTNEKFTELDKKTINNKISIDSSLPLNSRFIEFEIGDTNGGIAGEDNNDNAPKRFRSINVISIASQPTASIIRSDFTPSVIFRFHKEDGTYIGTEYTDEAKKMRIILANVNGNNNVDLRNLQECILTYNSAQYRCTKFKEVLDKENVDKNIYESTLAIDNSVALRPSNYTGFIDFVVNSTFVKVTLKASYILGRKFNHQLPASDLSSSIASDGDYCVVFRLKDNSLHIVKYDAVKNEDYNSIIIARFFYTNNIFSVISIISSYYTINGKSYNLINCVQKLDSQVDRITELSTSLPLNSIFIEFEIGDTNGGIAGEDDNDNAPKRFRSKDVISISSQPSASIKRVGFTPSIIFRFHKEDGTYIGTEYTDEAKKMRIILANVNGNNNVDLRNLQECILTYNSLDYKCTKYNLAASVDNLPTNVANITWAEIGDSFVEPDNNNGNGYGKIIREKLGIIQANHHAAGFSGYSWVTFYLYAILENDPKLNVITKDEDFISIGLGTNDWGANKLYPIGTKEDYINNTFVAGNNSTYTSYGAARKVIDWLLETRGKNTPNVILLSPMHRGQFSSGTSYRPSDFIIEDGKQKYIENTTWLNKNLTSEGLQTVENGFTLLDVYNMVKWIAEYEGFTFVDFFNNGFVKTRFLNQGYESEAPSTSPEVYTDQLSDNLHPYTEKGKNSYASMVYQYGFIPLLKL